MKLDPEIVRQYLRAKGWKDSPHVPGAMCHDVDGYLTVALPPFAMVDFASIAGVEDRTVEEVVASIALCAAANNVMKVSAAYRADGNRMGGLGAWPSDEATARYHQANAVLCAASDLLRLAGVDPIAFAQVAL